MADHGTSDEWMVLVTRMTALGSLTLKGVDLVQRMLMLVPF
jgi:hypothetical protein